MKLIESHDEVEFPKEVEFTVKNRIVQVKGPRGVLRKDFRHLNMEVRKYDFSKKKILTRFQFLKSCNGKPIFLWKKKFFQNIAKR